MGVWGSVLRVERLRFRIQGVGSGSRGGQAPAGRGGGDGVLDSEGKCLFSRFAKVNAPTNPKTYPSLLLM